MVARRQLSRQASTRWRGRRQGRTAIRSKRSVCPARSGRRSRNSSAARAVRWRWRTVSATRACSRSVRALTSTKATRRPRCAIRSISPSGVRKRRATMRPRSRPQASPSAPASRPQRQRAPVEAAPRLPGGGGDGCGSGSRRAALERLGQELVELGGRRLRAARRRPDHDHDFAARRSSLAIVRRQLGERASAHLLEALGQLARDRRGRGPSSAVRSSERIRQAARRLEHDERARHRRQLGDGAAPRRAPRRQEAGDEEAVGRQAGDEQAGERRRRAGHREHLDAGGDGVAHQLVAGIGDQRRARIADQRHGAPARSRSRICGRTRAALCS